MELQKAIRQLEMLQKKIYAYTMAESSIYVDSVTVAPKDTSEGRSIALGILASERQKLYTSKETRELLDWLSGRSSELDDLHLRQVKKLKETYERMTRIPESEYMEYMMLKNDASDIWHRAKETNDFALFLPALEKLIAYAKKLAVYYNSEKEPYDALLDEFEKGADQTYLDHFFSVLKERLIPLIHAIGEAEQIDDSFLKVYYPIDAQRKFSDYLMEVMDLDRAHCTIGETEHPFTQEMNNKDVRITTKYNEYNVIHSMYSVIHEGGHAKYEMGIRDDLQYTCLTCGVSSGVHESQSRFYENIIGRSRAFVYAIFPKMQEFFPEQLKDVTAEQMYRAVNKVEPSLIRTEADELTYCLHIMIRYEIEKKLIKDQMEAKDIPQEWKRLYKEYLGVDVPNDTTGCLQDCHWSGGMFGYFPSYALGSAYGAQMLRNMEQDIDVWGPVAKGDLSQVTKWLQERIHQYGSMYEPSEIVQKSCGTFDPTAYTDYLTKKYTDLYGLNIR